MSSLCVLQHLRYQVLKRGLFLFLSRRSTTNRVYCNLATDSRHTNTDSDMSTRYATGLTATTLQFPRLHGKISLLRDAPRRFLLLGDCSSACQAPGKCLLDSTRLSSTRSGPRHTSAHPRGQTGLRLRRYTDTRNQRCTFY